MEGKISCRGLETARLSVQLLSAEDETLLLWRDTTLLFDFLLDLYDL